MNDTPRTDAVEKHAYLFKDEFTPVCESKFVRRLERELNAANERIKQLEEAGDEMFKWSERVGQEFWTKAKEDKP